MSGSGIDQRSKIKDQIHNVELKTDNKCYVTVQGLANFFDLKTCGIRFFFSSKRNPFY